MMFAAAVSAPAGSWLLYGMAGLMVLFAILLLLAVLWIVTAQQREAAAKKKEEKNASTAQKQEEQTATGLAPSFLQAMSQLRFRVSGRDYRYRVPWYLMLGPAESGKTTLLTESHLRQLLEEDGRGFAGEHSIGWKFYGDGIVLDTAGAWSMSGDGRESSNWKRLLRLLNRHRPQRPLDGLIVTLACGDLTGSEALDQVALLRSASLLHDRLTQAQQILGFRLPVYFVVTKCDQVAGFRSFCRELPEERLRDIFGWSSPYNLDTAFDAGWVDEAFLEVRSAIEQTQNEIFAERDYTADRQKMFLFPGEMESLHAPLRMFLGRALRSTAYRESFYFRGIYFTGDSQAEGAAQTAEADATPQSAGQGAAQGTGQAAAPPRAEVLPPPVMAHAWNTPETSILPPMFAEWSGSRERIAFVYDLFVKKIFPERGIAHPISSHFFVRNRTTIALQATTVVMVLLLTIGTTLNYLRLRTAKHNVEPLLARIVHDLNTSSVDAAGEIQSASNPEDAGDLLYAMARFRTESFRSLFLPASWVSPMDASIRAAMVPAFRVLVLESFNNGLERRAAEVANPNLRPLPGLAAQSNPDAPLNFSVESLPEYQQLRAYVDQMQALDANIALYETIRKRGGGAGLNSIIDLENYISGKHFSVDMDAPQNPYFEEALQQASWTPFTYRQPDMQHASQKMEQLSALFFAAWIEHNPTLQSLQRLSANLNQVNTQMLVSYEQLLALQQAFHTADAAFHAPSLQWVAGENYAPTGAVYALTVAPLRSSHYFLPYLQQWVPYSAQTSFNKLQDNLADQRSTLTGPLVDVNGNSLEFTSNAEKFHISLDNLMNLPFVAKASAQKISAAPASRMQIVWNNPVLQDAIALPDAYNHYVQEDLQNAPVKMRATFERIASQRLSAAMEDEAVQAETVRTSAASGADASLRQDVLPAVEEFAGSAPALADLLRTFNDMSMDGPYERLHRVSVAQASSLLLALNATFDAGQPYAIPQSAYNNWLGDTTPTQAMLNAQTAEEVQSYLGAQRQQMLAYNHAAAPLVHFLSTQHAELTPSARRVLQRWQKIGAETSAYQAKRPGNSVSLLEAYVASTMDKIAPDNLCAATPLHTQGADYFLQVRSDIQHDLLQRCQTLSTFDVVREYGKLSGIFKTELAGRFPFAPPARAVLGSEVDPQSIRDFYTLFDADAPLLLQALTQEQYGASGQSVRLFVQQMESARGFFAAILDKKNQAALPAVDFTPEFRVNQSNEINGNQIMQWTLQVGQDYFQSGDKPRVGRWTYGEPVTLTLRWASNSPLVPYLRNTNSNVELSGQTLTYHFNDNWALLNLMAAHRTPAGDFAEMADPTPFTLVFQPEEDTNKTPASTGGTSDADRARVFLRLTVTPPGQQQSLSSDDFPEVAPPLVAPMNTASNTGAQP